MRRTLAALALVALVPTVAVAQEIEARFDRRSLAVGETTTLSVIVRGGAASGEPEFELPQGLEVLGSGKAQNFAWINGKMSNETVFRYEIGPTEAGSFQVGPIDVRVGGRVYRSGLMALEVTAAPERIGGSGDSGPAALRVDVSPPSPWVGQPVTLRVRLVQRASFTEDPAYAPPTTTGFWTDRPSAPESYYADAGRERVLVTETRTRLYPVAPGAAAIGEATATVVVAGNGDPLGWLTGRGRRDLTIRSRPLTVRVRALPDRAPASFTGAVGRFQLHFHSDRTRTARDVPITVTLDVRGPGNIPLIRPPVFSDSDVELFASASEDSLAAPGSDGPGRKRFQWTVLPRREGTIEIDAPAFSWFDLGTDEYREQQAPSIVVEVGEALFARGVVEGFPTTFFEHPIDPGRREPAPWAWGFGGLMVGAGVALWRSAGRRGDPAAAERARQLEWLRAVGTGGGPDFWRAADEASAWLEERGREVRTLRAQIATARYGSGGQTSVETVKRRLVEQLSQALPAPHPRRALRVAAVVAVLCGTAWCVVMGPRPGEVRDERVARAADIAARRGEIERARATWAEMWERGRRHPGLAARLAWSELQGGAVGAAARWVLRGERVAARDPALQWSEERVREAGGLVGSNPVRLPVTRFEWSVVALVLGALAGALWPRRRFATAAVALALLAATVEPFEGWRGSRRHTGVVLQTTRLDDSGLELQAGQVVDVRARDRTRGRLRVTAGRVVSGWLPESTVGLVEPEPAGEGS